VGFSNSAVNKGRPDVFEKPPVVEISDMMVLEEHRWRGIGTEMLNRIREWAMIKGITRIELNAEARNNIGLSFWKKHGFNAYQHRLYADL
jgi:GNAT superfamily N-acetyltransferase